MTADRPKSIEELALWAAEHDGRINALWAEQRLRNTVTDGRLNTMSTRLGALERKVMWFSGFAAALGGLLGALASRAIG